MTDVKLTSLYRDMLDREADAAGPLAAEDIVHLARGEHLGAAHEGRVEALARSGAATALYRVARGIGADAERLSAALAPAPARRAAPTWTRWALAASVLGAAVLLGRDLVVDRGPAPPAGETDLAAVHAPPQPLFSGSFERSHDAPAAPTAAKPIFNSDFGS